MAIKIDCPRCKQNLLVPEKKAGSYATCPRCAGRFWVPKEAGGDFTPAETVAAAGAGGPPAEAALAMPPPAATSIRSAPGIVSPAPAIPTPPAAAPPRPAAPAVAPPSAADRQPPPVVPLPPPPAKANRKVARLISAETAQSVLKPAADGRLPDLQLHEPGEGRQAESKSKPVNPLVLYGALTASAVVSLFLVLNPWGSPGPGASSEKDMARQAIEAKFFGGGADPADLKPFQMRLREAKRAHNNHDDTAEHACYEKVLRMLRADRGAEQRPLTGNPESDKELQAQIETILQGT